MAKMKKTVYKKNNPLVGNMGLYAVCYELSKRGWNVMPTSRNARGIDILAYDQDGDQKISIQVKALAKAVPVPLGADLCNLIADYFVIARGVRGETPEYFIAKTKEVPRLVHIGVSKKTGKKTCWLQPRDYKQFRDKWETIGTGWGQTGE